MHLSTNLLVVSVGYGKIHTVLLHIDKITCLLETSVSNLKMYENIRIHQFTNLDKLPKKSQCIRIIIPVSKTQSTLNSHIYTTGAFININIRKGVTLDFRKDWNVHLYIFWFANALFD